MTSSLIEATRKVYAPVIAWTPREIVSAQGCWVTDVEGGAYLDSQRHLLDQLRPQPSRPGGRRPDQLERLWTPAAPSATTRW